MSPAQTAKAYGLKSLTQVSEISGVSMATLNNWHREKEKLFNVVLLGCQSVNSVREFIEESKA